MKLSERLQALIADSEIPLSDAWKRMIEDLEAAESLRVFIDGNISDGEMEVLLRSLENERPTGIILTKQKTTPEGWKLVPEQMHLDGSDIEAFCSQCGDGGHMYGEFTEGILWVGDLEGDNGEKTYGLHISTADYPEQGAITVAAFDRPNLTGGEPSGSDDPLTSDLPSVSS